MLFGPGYAVGAVEIVLEPQQLDKLIFENGGTEIAYLTNAAVSPALFVAVEAEGADYLFTVQSAADPDGQEIHIHLDQTEKRLSIAFVGSQPGTLFALNILRVDEADEEEFEGEGETVGDTDLLHVLYGDWAGDGTPMTLAIDEGADGTIDQQIEIGDK